MTSRKPPSRVGTLGTFLKVGTCSTTLCRVLDRAYGDPLPVEERAAAPLAGGLLARGHQCGQVWGAALAAGARACRRFGPGPRAEAAALAAAQRIVGSFAGRFGSIECREIIGADPSDSRQMLRSLLRNGPRCQFMAARYAPVAWREIDLALDAGSDVPGDPVSCAAVVARRMGASGSRAVMAAGFAGGLGLSGSACGALAAALWLAAVGELERGAPRVWFNHPRLVKLADAFATQTGGRYACAEIAGRRFATVAEHAAFVRDGGCGRLIESLAAA